MTGPAEPDAPRGVEAAESGVAGSSDAATAIASARGLIVRADEVGKAAAGAADPAAVRDRARHLLADARALLDEVRPPPGDTDGHDDAAALAVQIARRMLDLDGADLAATARPSAGMRRAATTVDDPRRRPPGQHLTPGFPVLHVGAVPTSTDDWSVTITGRVRDRVRIALDDLRRDAITVTSDFHCVTGWSRLDNAWSGIAVASLLDIARPRGEATHAIVSGRAAYSANFALADLTAPGVMLAWAVDGTDLDVAHGGPLRLVVPHLYGWKSVKWVTEIRLVERDVPGYWEERGYHMRGDPWQEQRFRDD